MLNFYSKPIDCLWGVKGFIKTAAEAVEIMATENAEKFGYGRSVILNAGGFWIVSKIRFDIKDYPCENGEIIAETWPMPPSKIKVERQYRLKDKEGKVLLNGNSEWCVLNLGTRRPMRMDTDVFSGGHQYVTEKSGAGDFSRIRPEITEDDFCYEREIVESDIDLNQHTNNKKYTEMVLNCFSDEYLNYNPIKSYELHFLKETLLGDIIRIYKHLADDKTIVIGVSKEKTIFNAILEF